MLSQIDKVWLEKNTFWQASAGMYFGTFIDWSINYLQGIESHVVLDVDGYQTAKVPSSPICSNGTAHLHLKNHSGNFGEIVWQHHFLKKFYPNYFHSFYLSAPKPWKNKKLNSNIDVINFTEYLIDYSQTVIEIFKTNQTIPHIVVYPDFDSLSWEWLRRSTVTDNIKTLDLIAPEHNIKTVAKELIREQMALSNVHYYISQDQISQCQHLIRQALPDSLSFDLTSIVYDLENVLKKIQTRYPTIKFDNSKWGHWQTVYKAWQEQNVHMFEWGKNVSGLIDKIIKKQSCVVGNLTDFQEVAIETELLIKGYSIKNTNLKKFPTDLSLLELQNSIHNEYVADSLLKAKKIQDQKILTSLT
jgi:hypothetical protein